jgi:hypothetical protein
MDLEVLKKKISTYKTDGGKLFKVSDDIVMEVLAAWEQWTGPASGFYSSIGVEHRKLAKILGKGKRLKREGYLPASDFKEIKLLNNDATTLTGSNPCNGIEILWDGGKLIRFSEVEMLVDFLKKVA